VTSRFTFVDSGGQTHLRAWAIPLVVAAICVPVVAATAIQNAAVGLAVGALAATALIVAAVRMRPEGKLEVAKSADSGHRVLIVATAETTPGAAERIAELADHAVDVRVVVPLPSHRLERWLSAEDDARANAERQLARTAGTLVAAGLPVSGSLGDSDPAQALEDELRGYAADEVIVLAVEGAEDPLATVEDRLALPLSRVTGD
jgi:hypothetical protein